MLPEIGQIALILAMIVAALQCVLPLWGAHGGRRDWMEIARPAAAAQLAMVGLAFLILTMAFLRQDFSIKYVADNSNSLLPTLYRITAVWGAHEGSLLLWALILAVWTAAVAMFSRKLPLTVMARVLGVMGFVSAGFLAFLVFTSNPFERLLPAAADGQDLNPLLQDPGMVAHPPMLYLGYVGFAVPFAFAVAALLEGQMDARWLRWTRPWTNAAWGFLTLGIMIGSWWAYYELGWGGWWFWDPVENASFMPWLAGAALLHSQAVTEKRGTFAGWTLLLAIAAFSLSLLGTFLVRSGVLTSVHAFAADPTRGVFILVFLGCVVGGSLILYALRAHTTHRAAQAKPFEFNSRETLLMANNLLLASACAMVLIGTLYPLLADALNLGKVSVGPPYFGLLFILLMAPLVVLIPFGPLTYWQREQGSRVARMLWPWALFALVCGVIAFFVAPQGRLKTAAGIAAAVWVALGTWRFVQTRLKSKSAGAKMTLEMVGMAFAHTGIAVFLVGALLTEALSTQRELAMRPGDTVTIGRNAFTFKGATHKEGPNYISDQGRVIMRGAQGGEVVLLPEKRKYVAGGQVMTESAISRGVFRDVYVAMGEPLDVAPGAANSGSSSWAVRIHVKPFVRWIWFGAILMALGAFITAADKRFKTAPGAAA